MWVFLNDSFLSIVADRYTDERLVVRSQWKHDIRALFPGIAVVHNAGANYRCRATVPAEDVAQTIAARVRGID